MSEAGEAAFRDAIAAIENVSSVEVVVAVRPRLRRWLVAHLAVGLVLLGATLAFTLWSDYEFDLWSILVVTVLAGLVGGLAVEVITPLERALVPRKIVLATALEAARATFVEMNVHHTLGRSGLLVFVAVDERHVVLVGDRAVVEHIGDPGLARRAERLAAEIPTGAEAVAKTLAGLAEDFAKVLPRSAEDINELADAIHARRGVRRRFRGMPA
jgi:putative membrane protein